MDATATPRGISLAAGELGARGRQNNYYNSVQATAVRTVLDRLSRLLLPSGGAVNARALSLARKAVELCNCRRREAAAECLVEKPFGEKIPPITVYTVATLRLDVALLGRWCGRTPADHGTRVACSPCLQGALSRARPYVQQRIHGRLSNSSVI